jgi:predicted metal-dependent phosphoesterase TrpH
MMTPFLRVLTGGEPMNYNMKVDLHLHTTASDGTWGPEKLAANVRNAGIGLFAVTDHDSTESLIEVARLAKEYQLGFINGVEINTTYNRRNYHILGLGIDPANRELQILINDNRELMDSKDDESIKYLEKIHSEVSFSEYANYVNRRERGGWKALNYLIDKKICNNHKDFFSLFNDWGNPFETMTFAAPGEVIKVIGEAEGKSILAHPGASFYDRDYQRLIAFMIDEGIKGIECFHPENSPEITKYCLEICKSNKLLVTGGSDCHGVFLTNRSLGNPDICLSQLKIDGIWGNSLQPEER